ncbi:efflux RND transporter periplasmic adaptor subunit [Helicobacter pylori]|uniref:efflux RND transporter periplasmic adaptor subunit n=1 Tax=Helicobacter pylori TaxID=210 RepID=UPI0009936DAD|nr:efflux RND transporter periplasmic adaptor subunit [Helicobacter pylori]OOQ32510.1 hemolysin D [Helicobacter pylori]PDX11735.1 hemolysin D [Helicobacter pylori]
MKRLLLFALILFFSPLFANAQETKKTKEAKSQTHFNISTTKVIEKEFSQSRRYYALLEPNEALIFSQTLRFDGYVEKLYANKTYTPIKKGDKLLSVYSPELASVQSELLSSLKFNQQVGAIKEKLKLLGLENSSIEKIISSHKVQNEMTIYSRFNGVIFKKSPDLNEGSFFKKGQELFQIIDLSRLWALVKVNQEDLEFLKNTHQAILFVEGVKGKQAITLENINPIINAQDKMLEARFNVPNLKLLYYPNMFAQVEIFHKPQKMKILPKEAVLIKGGKAIVFKKDDFGLSPLEIKAVRLSDGSYEILEGLKAGEEVANNALFVLDADAQNNGDY